MKSTHLTAISITLCVFICYLCMAEPSFAGSIVAWGDNRYGQAISPEGNDFVAIAAGDGHSLALKSDGSIVAWGNNNNGQTTPPDGKDFVAIAAGGRQSPKIALEGHSLALRSDGSIVKWGARIYGSPDGNDFVAIAAGGDHILALKSDGSILGWGSNYNGEATPPDGNDFIAIAAGGLHSLALKSDSSIVRWGMKFQSEYTPPTGNDFVAIAAGYNHSLALKKNCQYELKDDLNNDCKVDFSDFVIMASHWLIDCNLNPENPACVPKIYGQAYFSGTTADVSAPAALNHIADTRQWQ